MSKYPFGERLYRKMRDESRIYMLVKMIFFIVVTGFCAYKASISHEQYTRHTNEINAAAKEKIQYQKMRRGEEYDEYLRKISLIGYNTQDFEKTAAICNEAIENYPEYYEAYVELARVYARTGEYQKAIDAAEKALGLIYKEGVPVNEYEEEVRRYYESNVLIYASDSKFRLGEYAESLKYSTKALEVSKTEAMPQGKYYILERQGDAKYKLGNKKGAIEDWQAALNGASYSEKNVKRLQGKINNGI